MKTKCVVCATEFEVNEKEIRRGKGRCCSKSCGSRWANNKIREKAGLPPLRNDGFQICNVCKQLLSETDFAMKRNHDKNHPWWWCNTCRNSYFRKHRKENVAKYLLTSARRRAKVTNCSFSLTLEDIKVPSSCPVLGVELVVGDPNNSPTLDRIDPKKGYVPSNVKVLSNRANRIKSDGSAEEHDLVAAYIRRETQASAREGQE